MLRQPTLRDAEVIRRTLDEIAYGLNISGKGQAGGNIQALALAIRTKLDKFSPKLKSVRKQAHIVRKGREAYDYGLGLITSKRGNAPEDVQVFIDEFGKLPGVMNALRIGITQALKNKEGSAMLKKMADEDKNMYHIITQVLSKQQLDNIMPLIQIGANTAKVSPQLQGAFGSQTADKMQMSRIAGASGGREGGLTVAIFDGVIQYMKRKAGLSDKHAKEYAEIITTNPENYKKLEKALIDDSSMGTFMKLLDSMITGAATTYGDLRAKTGATEVNEQFDPAGASGVEGLLELMGRKAFPMITGFQE